MAEITVERMEIDACAALMIDRAAGAPVPHADWVERVYKLGFASGAKWAIQTIQEEPCAGE